ncbi:MAG: translation elongation factor Ts [Gammaproteobacteria bacterium]
MSIAAATVKSLREETGAGMMECKKALVESGGDVVKARSILRARSGARARKVSSRTAGEGRVAFAQDGNIGALVCINCETDFVARDDAFYAFAGSVAGALCAAGVDAPNAENTEEEDEAGGIDNLPMTDGGGTLAAAREAMVMKMGENITIGMHRVFRAEGRLFHYLHPGEQIGAMADIAGGGESLGREVCMHIAAMRPQFLDSGDIPEEELAREREAGRTQAIKEGKPPNIANKIADGRVKKYLSEVALLHQPFIKDDKKTVSRALAESGAAAKGFALVTTGG